MADNRAVDMDAAVIPLGSVGQLNELAHLGRRGIAALGYQRRIRHIANAAGDDIRAHDPGIRPAGPRLDTLPEDVGQSLIQGSGLVSRRQTLATGNGVDDAVGHLVAANVFRGGVSIAEKHELHLTTPESVGEVNAIADNGANGTARAVDRIARVARLIVIVHFRKPES